MWWNGLFQLTSPVMWRIVTWVGLALLLGYSLILAYQAGWDAATSKAEHDKLEALTRIIEQHEQIERENALLNEAWARKNEARKSVVVKKVREYVQAHPNPIECLDADGLREWNATFDELSASPEREFSPLYYGAPYGFAR